MTAASLFAAKAGCFPTRIAFQNRFVPLFIALACLAVCSGRAANTVSAEASRPEALVTEAKLSLAEARKTHSDPRVAAGCYLQAADEAVLGPLSILGFRLPDWRSDFAIRA
jgi:hypothetical protein